MRYLIILAIIAIILLIIMWNKIEGLFVMRSGLRLGSYDPGTFGYADSVVRRV
jgi:hypothetical protein